MAADPIDGQIVMLAGAKASVDPARLSALVTHAQVELAGQVGRYRRRFERVHHEDHREAFLAADGHWGTLGERLGFSHRETAAVRRAHEEQLLRIGRREDRRPEFETALEIRDAVVIGT